MTEPIFRSVSSKMEPKKSENVPNEIQAAETAQEASKAKQSKLRQQLYPSLSLYEITFLVAAWIVIIAYSLFQVFVVSRKYYYHFLTQDMLEEGMFSKFR